MPVPNQLESMMVLGNLYIVCFFGGSFGGLFFELVPCRKWRYAMGQAMTASGIGKWIWWSFELSLFDDGSVRVYHRSVGTIPPFNVIFLVLDV